MQNRATPAPPLRMCHQADSEVDDGLHQGHPAPGHSAPGHSAPGHSAPGHSTPGHPVEAVLDAFDRSEVSKPVARALSYLLRNYSTPVSVQDLADLSGWSAFQMIRAFRKELGITPHALLIRIRVLSATTLLKQGEPIAGVAVDVGFVDQTHFTRHFKRMHGNTPGSFMKARQGAVSLLQTSLQSAR